MSTDIELKQREHDDAPATASKTIDPDRALFAEAVTINRPAQDLYAFWRNPTNLVYIMDNIRAIEPIDENRSRWTVKAPAGQEVSWERAERSASLSPSCSSASRGSRPGVTFIASSS